MGADREMTLVEYVSQLASCHSAYHEYEELEDRLKLAEKVCEAYASFRNVAGSAGLRYSHTGRDVIKAHDAYLAAKEKDSNGSE